jgi:hypothetical protein
MISKIFIASSSTALLYAKQLGELLKKDQRLLPVVWDESGAVFDIAKTYIESLVDALSDFDYAVMVFHPDDSGVIKGEQIATTRDNVVFEYGLFIGKLGRDKCYIVQPKNINLRIPSDLMGVNNAQYEYQETQDLQQIKTLMQPAASLIINRIAEVNQIRKDPPRNVQIINGYLHMATTQRKTYSKLEDCIRDGVTLPEEILYWSVESANAWLNYEQETFQNANMALALIARKIDEVSKNEYLHFISLGCGSGEKDVLMLNMLSPNERLVSYFPVDQSYTLLENAITETLANINADDLYVRGIRADFRQLPSFRHIFNKKNTVAVFSMLGCTLGNYDEVSLLTAISECMKPGDMLILEIALISEELLQKQNGDIIESGKYADRKLQDFLLSPIKPFVKELKRESLLFIIDKDNTSVKESIRVIVRFDNKELPEQHPFDIAYSTHYKKEELTKYLKEQHELETIYDNIHKKNIYLLCQKPKQVPQPAA